MVSVVPSGVDDVDPIVEEVDPLVEVCAEVVMSVEACAEVDAGVDGVEHCTSDIHLLARPEDFCTKLIQ